MPEDSGIPVDDVKTDTVLSRKMKKILDSKLENDNDTMDALKELSTFFTENNLKNRRNLRGEIERKNLQINHDFLAAFETVKVTLDSLHSNVVGMSKSCSNMQARLAASTSGLRPARSVLLGLEPRSSRLETKGRLFCWTEWNRADQPSWSVSSSSRGWEERSSCRPERSPVSSSLNNLTSPAISPPPPPPPPTVPSLIVGPS